MKSPVIGYRISGDDVLGILEKLTYKNFSKDHARIKLTKLYRKDGTILDECSVVYFKSPKSFTGEDVCEIFLHGSPLIASQFEQTLKDFKILNLRLAKNGEFSYRSVLNSKNSLKQAKAINSIISNDSFSSLEYNKKLLFEGDVTSGLMPLREDIINLFSEITASIDLFFHHSEERVGICIGISTKLCWRILPTSMKAILSICWRRRVLRFACFWLPAPA